MRRNDDLRYVVSFPCVRGLNLLAAQYETDSAAGHSPS
jgi:hypothetical protein